jgi:hypothetical protein
MISLCPKDASLNIRIELRLRHAPLPTSRHEADWTAQSAPGQLRDSQMRVAPAIVN